MGRRNRSGWPESAKFPVNFPVSKGICRGDRFDPGCPPPHSPMRTESLFGHGVPDRLDHQGLPRRHARHPIMCTAQPVPDHHRPYQCRSRNPLCGFAARLPCVPAQTKMLPEYALAPDRARCERGCSPISLVLWPRPRLSSSRAAIANASRCCSPISSAF